jgi:hypothetical protein
MIQVKSLLESKKDTVVVALCRLNPPSKNHGVITNALKTISTMMAADHILFVTPEVNQKKLALNTAQKFNYAKQSFPNINHVLLTGDANPSIVGIAKEQNYHYSKLVVLSSNKDSLPIKQQLDSLNGVEFNYQSILVVPAYEKDPDDDSYGCDLQLMKQSVIEGNFAKFKQFVSSNLSSVQTLRMFEDMSANMGVAGEKNKLREDYVKEEIFKVGDIVKHNNLELAIVFRGSNYVVLENNEKAWLTDIKKTNKVNESIMVKHQDKLKAAQIIGMSLGYDAASTKTDPTAIVNTALRMVKNKPFNPEAKKILARMLELARKMEINFDAKIIDVSENVQEEPLEEISDTTVKSYTQKAMRDTITGKKDRNKGMTRAYSRLAGTNKPLLSKNILGEADGDAPAEEDEEHILMHKKDPKHVYSRVRKIQYRVNEEEDGDELEDLSDEELDRLANSLTDDDIIEHGYDDEEFEVVDEETGEVEEPFNMEPLVEVLTRVERMRARVRIKRTEARRERAKRIALQKRSTTQVLTKRARRVAVKALKQRFAKKPLNKLSVAEKERLEKRLEKMKPLIARMAVRLLPRVRSVEKERLTHKSTK